MQGASGAGDKVHCLMLGFFIQTHRASYHQAQVASLFHRHELEKRREYGDRTRVIDGESFTPLVFSTFGGLGKETTIFYNRLANLLSHQFPPPGYNVCCPFPCYVLQYLPFVGAESASQ